MSNCVKTIWKKYELNPVIKFESGTWKHHRVANNSVLLVDKKYYFYYRGGYGCWWEGVPGHSAIGVRTVSFDEFDAINWNEFILNPILTHGPTNSFFNMGPIDPYVIYARDRFYLYFAGVSCDPHDRAFLKKEVPIWKKSIGVAVSDDGFSFKLLSENPIIENAGATCAFYHNEQFYLFYSRCGEVYLSVSDDGINFVDYSKKPVLPKGETGECDSKAIGNAKLLPLNGKYYFIYDANDEHGDYPAYFGVACSDDLVNWRKYHGNPIFERGKNGQWDDGGIWVGDILKHKDKLYLWYEGRSGGTNRNQAYAPGGFSQIGLAMMDAEEFYKF
ncbi:MAG: glycoside hydrolase family protein [Sedimentisphaerales bacterium]